MTAEGWSALGVVLAGVAVVVAVVSLVITAMWRKKDRGDQALAAVRGFVRECENHRILWYALAYEQRSQCYDSVQRLRTAVGDLRGALPDGAVGHDELAIMKSAAERLSTELERSPFAHGLELQPMVEALREEFVPALDRLRTKYGIRAAEMAPPVNPFIGEEIAEIDIPSRPEEPDSGA